MNTLPERKAGKSMPLEIVLYAGYTIMSVLGLIIAKHWLPVATLAWHSGSGIVTPGLMVGLGMGLYVVSFLLWMVILARNDLSIAYPTAIGLTLVFSTLTAAVWLGETVSMANLLGILLIFAGIVLVVRQ